MSQQLKYEDVEQYLRSFSTEDPAYDFGGLLRLVLAGVEGLRKNMAEGDILEYAHFITNEQEIFLRQLLQGRAESTEVFVNEITHRSQTGLL